MNFNIHQNIPISKSSFVSLSYVSRNTFAFKKSVTLGRVSVGEIGGCEQKRHPYSQQRQLNYWWAKLNLQLKYYSLVHVLHYPFFQGVQVYISVSLCAISYVLLYSILQLVFHYCSETAIAIFFAIQCKIWSCKKGCVSISPKQPAF